MGLTVSDVVDAQKHFKDCGTQYCLGYDDALSLKISPEKVVGMVIFDEKELVELLSEQCNCDMNLDCDRRELARTLISNKSKILGLRNQTC